MEKWVDVKAVLDAVPRCGETAGSLADKLKITVVAPLARDIPFIMRPIRILHAKGAREPEPDAARAAPPAPPILRWPKAQTREFAAKSDIDQFAGEPFAIFRYSRIGPTPARGAPPERPHAAAMEIFDMSFVIAVLGSVAPIPGSVRDPASDNGIAVQPFLGNVGFDRRWILGSHIYPDQTQSFLNRIGAHPNRSFADNRRIWTIGKGSFQVPRGEIINPAMVGAGTRAREIARSIVERYATVRTTVLDRVDLAVITEQCEFLAEDGNSGADTTAPRLYVA